MTAKLLLFATALCLCSCSKENTPGGGAHTRFEVTAAYEDRPYDYNEAIESVITVQATDAGDEQFLLFAEITGGAASLTVEGKSFVSGDQMPYDYQIVNSGGSFATLHLTVTPQANDAADYGLDVRLRISTPDGTSAVERLLHIDVANKSQIEATATKDKDPLEAQQSMCISLLAHKPGFSGIFAATPHITEGEGYFTLDGLTIQSGDLLELEAGASLSIQYHPTVLGRHKILFYVTDSVAISKVPVTCEVYSSAALTYPASGVYIYAKRYDRSPYFTIKEWKAFDKGSAPEADGIAIISTDFKYLIPKESFSGKNLCGEDDNLLLIPGFVIVEGFAGNYTYQGRENTGRILDAVASGIISSADVVRTCYEFDPENPGRWYLPSSGQLYYITWRFDDVLAASKLIGSEFLTKTTSYFTSTGFSPTLGVCKRVLTLSVDANSIALIRYAYAWNKNPNTCSFFPVKDL